MNLPRKHNRDGIALVIVLGFVAVLAILGVSLMVSMRIERLATSSFAETVRARQLANVALARGLDDLDTRLHNDRLIYPDFTMYSFQSGTTEITNVVEALILPYVQADLTSSIPNSIKLEDVTVGTNVIGRVGYLAVDASGLLDVNVIGTTSRGRGHRGAEIPFSGDLLSGFSSLTGFLDYRSNDWHRFETLWEMYYSGVTAKVFAASPPSSFFTYSQFGLDLNPRGQPKVSLAGTTEELEGRSNEIAQAFTDSGFNNGGAMAQVLLDYVDVDSTPRSVNSVTAEAIPMINEIIVSNQVVETASGSGIFRHTLYCTIEVWYPFMSDYEGPSPVDIKPFPAPIAFGVCVPAELKPAPTDLQSTAADVQFNVAGQNWMKTLTYKYEKVATVTNFHSAGAYNNALAIQVKLTGPFELVAGGASLDRVDLSSKNFNLVLNNAPQNGLKGASIAFSVADPRLNHDIAQWVSESASPNATNNNTQVTYGAKIEPMYVRNYRFDGIKGGVGLASLAELGYLPTGKPWETIRLVGPNASSIDPVLDYFIATTNQMRRGLVNINSDNKAVVASALVDATLNVAPGKNRQGTMTAQAATTFAENLINNLSGTRYGTNRSLSVLGEIPDSVWSKMDGEADKATGYASVFTNEIMKESVLRTSADLFGYRQNLFTVFLYAQSITPGGATGAEQRAVAIVWRDPEPADVTGGSATNKMFMRFFRWL